MKWLVKANVLNTVGPAAMCSFDPPYVMTFVGHPRPPWPSDSRQTNPATAFEVDKIYIEPLPDSSPEYLESIHISPKIREFKDKESFVTQACKYQMAALRQAEEEERQREGESPNLLTTCTVSYV